MKTRWLYPAIAAALLLAFSPVYSANILSGSQVRVDQPISGNVYAGGGDVTVSAPIDGDLNVGAGTLTLLDTVRHQVMAAGGRLEVRGVIMEDLRCAGGQVFLDGVVNGDVIMAGGSLEIGPNAVIVGDLVVAGGQVTFFGQVKGSLVAGSGDLRLEGSVTGPVEIRGGNVLFNGTFSGPCNVACETIVLGSKAAFLKEVRYWQRKGEMDFSAALKEGAPARFDPSLQGDAGQYRQKDVYRFISAFVFLWFLAAALVIVLLVLLFRGFFRRAGASLPDEWLSKFGTGILFLLVAPLGAILLMVTVIGIPVGLLVLTLYLFSIGFAHALTAVVGAYALERNRGASWTKGRTILVALGLFVALKLISAIPFLGFFLSLIAVSIAFGVLLQEMVALWRSSDAVAGANN